MDLNNQQLLRCLFHINQPQLSWFIFVRFLICAAVTLRNSQRSIPVDLARLQSSADTLLSALQLSDYSLSIWLTTDRTVREKNRLYRSKDKSTDILSFPFQPLTPPPHSIPTAERPKPPPIHGIKDIGEIIISMPYVQKQVQTQQVEETNLDDRLRLLVVHGVCHLLGSERHDELQHE